MTADPMARDPVGQRRPDMERIADLTDGAATLAHVPFLAQVDLRLDPRLAGRAPYRLPLDANTWLGAADRAALWLGPDEWLIVGPPGSQGRIAEELSDALEGEHRSIIDVTANRVALELSGRGRFDLLAKGCSVDLHPRRWNTGKCVQTLLGRAQVILHERGDGTGVLVRTSFAHYLLDWCLAAADEAEV